jgi:cytochrome b6-f complex iron-sulfur subunit
MAAPTDDDSTPGLDRRRVLQLLLSGSGLAVAGLAGAPVLDVLRPLEPPESEAVARLASGSIGLWEARPVVVAGRPVLVVRTDEGLRAFSAVCTHLGCVVKWKKGRREFFCPCHGARFSAEGDVMGGPAPRSLTRLAIDEADGSVVVRRV